MTTMVRPSPFRVCTFCGSSPGTDPVHRAAAEEFGRLLARCGHPLVYGGGSVGLMGVLADAVLSEGGEVYGVIPRALATKEVAHAGLTELHVVATMHERKALMAELSSAFVALPGGFGTLDELFEAVTWSQLGIHRKPIGVLNVKGYFDPLIRFVDHAIDQGFVRADCRRLLLIGQDPLALLDALGRHVPPPLPRWVNPDEV